MENQILIVGGLILGLIGLIFFLIIILRLVSKTIKSNPINLMYYLFGFLVTSYFYPSGFKGIINLIRSFFLETYMIILLGDSGDQQRTDRLINSIFDSKLWFDSIIFVCFFLLVSFLSSRIMRLLTKPDLSKNDQVPSRNNTVVKNLIVSFVLILALYFSISSIIAVPIVSYQSSDDVKLSAELKEELTTYSKNDTLLKKEYIEFIEKKEYLFEKDPNFIEMLPLISDNFLNSKKEVNSIFRDIEQVRDRAIARMKITDNSNINPRLRLKDKSELSGWYLENRSSLLSYLNNQQDAMNIYITATLVGENLGDFFSYQQFLNEISDKYKITKIPSRPTLGSDLGVFTLFTGWLLSVESYPLVIIIGLIGFGLLGAGGSTFIREQSKDEKEALIDDLAGVLIKGFTAAIVVFLGVQGSLAVLTTNTGNLNAYALFFVSFVAAVFSDDAWGWAKNRFGNEFNSNENSAANNVQNGNTP